MDINLNQRIKTARTALKLSQAKFAERMAISPSYLAEMELNKKSATERVVRLLAMEFNVSAHWLRTGEGEMFAENEMDPQLAKAISLFKTFDTAFQECALQQMDVLSQLQKTMKTA